MPRRDVTVFSHYPHFIGSIDFLKSERHRSVFLRDAPDLIIVDEAHIAARPRGATGVEQQRYDLLHDLFRDPTRHIILVTATPHSGIEESFRSLLGLLNPAFEDATERKSLLPHVVQRRRQDVEKWLGSDTPFPERVTSEERYELGSEYRRLFEDVLEYCRDTVEIGGPLRAAQQRVRHWAAIAILRCLLSSPAAAASVLAARIDRMASSRWLCKSVLLLYTIELAQLADGTFHVSLTATTVDEEEPQLLIQEIASERVVSLEDALAVIKKGCTGTKVSS